jgi:hypothetical protein
MSAPSLRYRWPLCLAALAGAILLVTSPAPGQGGILNKAALDAKETREVRALIQGLFKGETSDGTPVRVDPKDKEHQEAVKLAAMQVTYPYTWRDVYSTPGQVQKVFEELETRLAQLARNKDKVGALAPMYTRQVIDRALQVVEAGKEDSVKTKTGRKMLTKGRPIVSMNGARVLARLVARPANQTQKQWAEEVLPRLALPAGEKKGNGEHLAGVLTGLVQDVRHNDAVKYWALRGLADLLALPAGETPVVPREARDEAVKAALALAQRKLPLKASTPAAEVEGYKVLRREAIKVVAQSRTPAVGDKDYPALFLLRVAADDKRIVPEPRLDERLEAAIGLARLRAAPKDKEYQPDLAAWGIGHFVRDFAEGYTANRNQVVKDKKGKPISTVALRLRPWRVDAARLKEALEGLKDDMKNRYVGVAVGVYVKQLEAVGKDRVPSAADVESWLATNKAPSKVLFHSVPGTDVQPREKEGAEKPEE